MEVGRTQDTRIDPGAVGSTRLIGRGTDSVAAVSLFIGFLGLYLCTLCPTVYLGDSGELCTAIATGGVPHPPGYPLFSLLGRIALTLIPIGEPAYRIGCVVALAAAGCVVVLYAIGRVLGCSTWASACGAASYGVGYTFWSQSTRVEVYSLHVFLSGMVLWTALQYRRSGRPCWLATSVLFASLGLAHHLTIVFLVPSVLLLCGRRLWQDRGRVGRLGLLMPLLAVGPALYLLLLVWARAEPLHAWGHTVNLPLLWNHGTARIFRIFLAAPAVADLPRLWLRAGVLFHDNFPFLTYLLPIAGVMVLWKREREIAAGLLVAVLAISNYNLFYTIDDIASYYLVVWLLAAACLTVAVDAMARQAGRSPGPVLAAIAFVLIMGASLRRNWNSCDLSRVTWVRDFARHKLEHTDTGSVLITQGDDDTNPIWYVHDVLGVRPDVTPIDRAATGGRTWGLYDWDPSLWYLYRLKRQGVNAPLQVPADEEARAVLAKDGYLIRLLDRELRGRPLCMTFLPPGTVLYQWVRQRYDALPLGVVVRLHPKRDPVDLAKLLERNERLWSRITLPDVRSVRTDQEIAPDYVARHYACMLLNLGGLYEQAGQPDRAAALYRKAAQWAPGFAPAQAALTSVVRNGRI